MLGSLAGEIGDRVLVSVSGGAQETEGACHRPCAACGFESGAAAIPSLGKKELKAQSQRQDPRRRKTSFSPHIVPGNLVPRVMGLEEEALQRTRVCLIKKGVVVRAVCKLRVARFEATLAT